MSPITLPPQTYKIIGDTEFNARVIDRNGDVNRALGLGVKTSHEVRDFSGDGVDDVIVKFNSGKQLFVVSNYDARTITVTVPDCTAQQNELRKLGPMPQLMLDDNGRPIGSTDELKSWNRQAIDIYERLPCIDQTKTIPAPAGYWNDIDRDGITETVAGTFQVDANTRDNSWTFVVETPLPANRAPKIGN